MQMWEHPKACVSISLANKPQVNHAVWAYTKTIGRDPIGELWVEYCDLGTLQSFHDKEKRIGYRRLPERLLVKLMKDIAAALCWVHHGIHWRPGSVAPERPNWDPVTHGVQ